MKKGTIETMVGLFVLVGVLCVGYLAIQLGKMELLGSDYYRVSARFDSASGLKPGSQVVIAGVQIGQVERVSLDHERQMALVGMKIDKEVVISDDVIASIKTSGLIGDRYVKLSPGGSDETIPPGGMIIETESPLDVEDLVGKYVFGDMKK